MSSIYLSFPLHVLHLPVLFSTVPPLHGLHLPALSAPCPPFTCPFRSMSSIYLSFPLHVFHLPVLFSTVSPLHVLHLPVLSAPCLPFTCPFYHCFPPPCSPFTCPFRSLISIYLPFLLLFSPLHVFHLPAPFNGLPVRCPPSTCRDHRFGVAAICNKFILFLLLFLSQ